MRESTPIAVVERDTTERVPPKELRDDESSVVVAPEYEAGLYRIEENDHLVVVSSFTYRTTIPSAATACTAPSAASSPRGARTARGRSASRPWNCSNGTAAGFA